MNLWIETGNLARAQALFGVPPLERLRRSVGNIARAEAQLGAPPLERLRRSVGHLESGDIVTLSGPRAAEASWPGARIDADSSPLGTRLRRALTDAPGPLVALDGANVTDPRLIRFLASSSPCVASRGEGAQRATALSLDRSLATAIPPEATSLQAVADALIASGRIAPLDERTFPAYMNKLRRSLPWWQSRWAGASSPSVRPRSRSTWGDTRFMVPIGTGSTAPAFQRTTRAGGWGLLRHPSASLTVRLPPRTVSS